MKFRRLFAVLLFLLLLVQAAPVRASATQAETQKHYNIMIVMDCSHSLNNPKGIMSDPQGFRYDATSMFLDLLSDSGNNVGAIVFNSTLSTSDCSDETMRQGLQLNTGVLPMNSAADKEHLMQQIRSIEPDGFTDIGTALLAAAEHLKGMEAKNGLESIIILFTDGATETVDKYKNLAEQPVYAQSLKNRDAAVELIRQEGITLCGVYLRRDQVDLENNEVLRLVRDANGYDPNATYNQVGGMFIHVQEAASLADAFQKFYTIISGTGAKTFEGEKTFRIPGTGVDEVNITVNLRGDTLEQCAKDLQNLKVTLVRPGNVEYTPQELAAITSLGTSYAVYKIQKPEAGQWKILVECTGADIQSSILLSTSVRADAGFSVAPGDIRINKHFTATARLLRSGEPLANADAYQEYACTLMVQNAKTGEVWPVQMYYDEAQNAFNAPLYIRAYGEYYTHVEFTCGDSVKILTPDQYWQIKNEPPQAPEMETVPITLNHLFSAGTAEIDLRTLVMDKEDEAKDIVITVEGGSYDREAWELNGSILTLDGAIGGNGSVTAIFTDTDGAQTMTEIRVVFTNNLVRNMFIAGIILAILAVLLGALWFKHWSDKRVGGKLPGKLQLTLPLTESEFVPLTVEAQSCVQQNLYDVLSTHRSTLIDNAEDRYCTADDVDIFLAQFRRILSGVKITSIRDKKTREEICRLTGLPGEVRQVDIRKQGQAEISLPDYGDQIILQYNRYQ